MSYTVLARKYRSQTFDDLVGQDAVATTLKNAVIAGRVHHGYLFTGTRGVGKTSSARVLAKALNCQKFDAPTPTPCCECESCRSIAEGEDIDVIEIDAASNTGVDNIRDLRNNAAYRPARSRYKVYIIDEVHMLSTGAFNALLKTLEEPPDHVKFILATTEIQKVPATIVSRCQRFDFRSISVTAIAEHLKSILATESIQADDAVVRRIARLANGSMRDALSLLDQLLSFSGGAVTTEMLDDVLPCPHDEIVAALIDEVAAGNAAGALERVEQSLSAGQTMERFCEVTIEHLRALMLFCVCGPKTELIDLPSSARDQLVKQCTLFDGATYVYMISLMEELRRAAKSSNVSRALLDAAVVRLAMAEKFSDVGTLIARLEGGGGQATSQDSGGSVKRVSPPARPAPTTPPGRRTTASSPAAVTSKNATPAKKAAPAKRKPVSRANTADESRARKNPAVRQAIDLFGATLVEVKKTTESSSGETQQDGNDSAQESAQPPTEPGEG